MIDKLWWDHALGREWHSSADNIAAETAVFFSARRTDWRGSLPHIRGTHWRRCSRSAHGYFHVVKHCRCLLWWTCKLILASCVRVRSCPELFRREEIVTQAFPGIFQSHLLNKKIPFSTSSGLCQAMRVANTRWIITDPGYIHIRLCHSMVLGLHVGDWRDPPRSLEKAALTLLEVTDLSPPAYCDAFNTICTEQWCENILGAFEGSLQGQSNIFNSIFEIINVEVRYCILNHFADFVLTVDAGIWIFCN